MIAGRSRRARPRPTFAPARPGHRSAATMCCRAPSRRSCRGLLRYPRTCADAASRRACPRKPRRRRRPAGSPGAFRRPSVPARAVPKAAPASIMSGRSWHRQSAKRSRRRARDGCAGRGSWPAPRRGKPRIDRSRSTGRRRRSRRARSQATGAAADFEHLFAIGDAGVLDKERRQAPAPPPHQPFVITRVAAL